jgi:hypothetical protein
MWLGRVFAPPAEWRFIAPADTEGPNPGRCGSSLSVTSRRTTYWATVRRWHYAASGRASGEEELAGIIKSPAEAGLRSGRNATS